MIPESPLARTEHGLIPQGGRLVRAERARRALAPRPRAQRALRLRGRRSDFPQLGINIIVLEPGEPMAMYHWEADQEDFLVLAGEALLIVEGEERPLRAWDFVHCPPETKHVIVGAGERAVRRARGRRARRTRPAPDWGGYTVDEAALRHGAGVEQETNDADAGVRPFQEARAGLLPRRLAAGVTAPVGRM